MSSKERSKPRFELANLDEIAEIMILHPDLDQLLKMIVDKTCKLMQVKTCSLMLVDAKEKVLKVKVARGIDEKINGQVQVKIGEDISGWIARTGRPLLIKNIEKDQRFRRRNKERFFTKSLLSVPLKINDKLIGVLNVNNKASGDIFTPQDLQLLCAVSNQLAIAIENHRLYLKLAAFNRNLEEEIKHLSEKGAKTEEHLMRAQKLAVIGELGAEVAHELNSPLTTISSLTQFILKNMDEISSTVRDYLSRIEKESHRCQTILRNLLNFSRKGDGKMVSANVNHLIEETLPLIEHQFSGDNIVVKRNLDPDLPHIMADRDQVQQVFINLILNAAQAMPGGGTITIATSVTNGCRSSGRGEWHHAQPSENFVEIRFKDTGCGVAKKNLVKLFDPFFTTKDQGTGLGLAISRTIVLKHRGRIEVVSKLRFGTTFTIRLPVIRLQKTKPLNPCNRILKSV